MVRVSAFLSGVPNSEKYLRYKARVRRWNWWPR